MRVRLSLGLCIAAAAAAGCPQPIDIIDDDGVLPEERDGGQVLRDGGPVPIRDGGPPPVTCGNDRLDPGETCDDVHLNGATCTSLGEGTGTLACKADCRSYDLGGCSACTPECGARECGPDPRCGMSCGTCDLGDACNLAGVCVTSCAPGTYTCSADGFGWQGCGFDPATGVDDVGPRIACANGEVCDVGAGTPCVRTACQAADVVFLVDRSASMATGSTWSWMHDVLVDGAQKYQHTNRFGARELPGGSSCAAAPLIAPDYDNVDTIGVALTPPGAETSSPLADAFRGLAPTFPGRHDAQSIVLVTDSTETCEDEEVLLREVSALFRIGVRTFVIGLTSRADLALLHRVAEVGGTGSARTANDAVELAQAMTDILEESAACEDPHAEVSAGYYHACGRRVDGTLTCWGRNLDGQSSPPLGSFVDVDASTEATCAVDDMGRVRCWGRQLNGQTMPPAGVFTQVSGGDSFFCGLRQDRTIACWGTSTLGQTTPPSGTFRQIATAGFSGCGIRDDATLECWGTSRPPTLGGQFLQIAGGDGYCGLRVDQEVACTGSLSPAPSGPFLQVDAGQDHACAVRPSGEVACWGADLLGQSTPPENERFVQVSVNNQYSCGVTVDDRFLCWGEGGNGQTMPPP